MAALSRIQKVRHQAATTTRQIFLPKLLAALALTLSASACLAAAPSTGSASGIYGPSQWLHDYAQGRQLSRDLGLPLIVHFHAAWCGPCQQMERETLSSRQLLGQLGRQVLGVKIDSDEEPGLVEAFRVDGLPCDIVIAPDGLIVDRNSGYQTQSKYLAMVAKMSGRFQEERAAAIARLQTPTPARPATGSIEPTTPPEAQPNGPDSRNLASNPQQPLKTERANGRPATTRQQPDTLASVPQPSGTPAAGFPVANTSPLVGLDGYCPVHIKTLREWIKGDPRFSTTWQGVVYNFASEDDLRSFQAAPQKYAPRMLGCDPVELWTSERAVQGSVEYGAFFNGELFLFVSAASRNQFKVNPNRYVQLRHAFRADDVIGTRLR
ncbi:thioredoxin fold domain-containing protein [bacterium]|nr:thioredoxin fold domain-containing protein [bacterium]